MGNTPKKDKKSFNMGSLSQSGHIHFDEWLGHNEGLKHRWPVSVTTDAVWNIVVFVVCSSKLCIGL